LKRRVRENLDSSLNIPPKNLFSINLLLFRATEYLIQKNAAKVGSCDNYYYSPSERVIHNYSQGNTDRYLDRKKQKNLYIIMQAKGATYHMENMVIITKS
jgi:hypothetical protein